MSSQIVGWFVNQDFPVCEECIGNFSEESISSPFNGDDELLSEDIVCSECGEVIIEKNSAI